MVTWTFGVEVAYVRVVVGRSSLRAILGRVADYVDVRFVARSCHQAVEAAAQSLTANVSIRRYDGYGQACSSHVAKCLMLDPHTDASAIELARCCWFRV